MEELEKQEKTKEKEKTKTPVAKKDGENGHEEDDFHGVPGLVRAPMALSQRTDWSRLLALVKEAWRSGRTSQALKGRGHVLVILMNSPFSL